MAPANVGWYDEPPASSRFAFFGMTNTGKSAALKELLAERYPRVIVLDHLGTQWPKWDGARVVYSFPEAVVFLRQVAPLKSRWRLVCAFPQGSEDVAQLFALLAPDPRKKGFARAVGGVTLLMDELVKVVPNGAPPIVQAGWSNGRHSGLTILGAAQRPSQVARIVTASSDYIGVFRMHEPTDLAVIQEFTSPVVMAELAKLPQYGLILWNTLDGKGRVIHSPRLGVYKVVRELNPAADRVKRYRELVPKPETKPGPVSE